MSLRKRKERKLKIAESQKEEEAKLIKKSKIVKITESVKQIRLDIEDFLNIVDGLEGTRAKSKHIYRKYKDILVKNDSYLYFGKIFSELYHNRINLKNHQICYPNINTTWHNINNVLDVFPKEIRYKSDIEFFKYYCGENISIRSVYENLFKKFEYILNFQYYMFQDCEIDIFKLEHKKV